MKTPSGLQSLIDDGVIDEVMRPLKSGKEAAVYVVRAGHEIRCAKVYKDMAQRSFQQRVQYQEGRKVRGSRDARAIGKASKYGRKQQETAWKNTEVEALHALRDAGVPVLTCHDLRHTAASIAVHSGANVKALQRMLGHKSAAMTLDRYADLFDKDLDTVSDAVEKEIAKALR